MHPYYLMLVHDEIRRALSRMILAFNDPTYHNTAEQGILARVNLNWHVRRPSVHNGTQTPKKSLTVNGKGKSLMIT